MYCTILDLRLPASFHFVVRLQYRTPYRHAGLYLVRLVLDPSSRNSLLLQTAAGQWPVPAVPWLHNFWTSHLRLMMVDLVSCHLAIYRVHSTVLHTLYHVCTPYRR